MTLSAAERVKAVIAEVLQLDGEDLAPQATMGELLSAEQGDGGAEMMIIELVMELDKRFSPDIYLDEFHGEEQTAFGVTVKDLIDWIEKHGKPD